MLLNQRPAIFPQRIEDCLLRGLLAYAVRTASSKVNAI